MRNVSAERLKVVALAAGCAYEIAALVTPLPTITTMIKRAGKHRAGRVAVWLWVGYVSEHFLEG
jgi:threonine dehydrogenase-like Zn-dependent dehydrogenase